MEYRFTPEGVCSSELIFEIEGDVVKSLKVIGGCPGNTVGISKLVQNKKIDEIIELLSNIPCGNKGTSCPDQIAKALYNYRQKNNIII